MKSILLFLSALFLLACSGKGSSENSTQIPSLSDAGDGITLTGEQIKMAEIRTGELSLARLNTSVTVNGTVVTPPNGTVHISLPYRSIVKKVLVKPNAFVREGEPLVEVIGTDLIMIQENYIAAGAALQVAEKEYDRQIQLAKEDATTSKVLEQVKADYANAKARFSAAAAAIESAGLSPAFLAEGKVASSVTIKAPLSGTVNMEDINVGDNIESGARLLTVISKSSLQLRLAVYEKDLADIKINDSVNFKIVGETDFTRKGMVSSIGSVVHPETRAIHVTADILGDRKDLAVGMYVITQIRDGGEPVMVIPETGLIAHGEKKYIYRVEDETFIPCEVTTGLEENGLIEIKNAEALQRGATYVTYGAYYIFSLQNKEQE